MLLPGKWELCADYVSRPIIEVEILDANGIWVVVKMLLDTGADRTVLSNLTRETLGIAGTSGSVLGGIGGETNSESIQTEIRLTRTDRGKVILRGEFAAFLQDEALDMSVLGRDITNLFAVVIDTPGDTVCLLGQQHRYRIEATP